MIINLNKDLKANFDFWIVYDNYGIRELQHITGEGFSTINEEAKNRTIAEKNHLNFTREAGRDKQFITINRK